VTAIDVIVPTYNYGDFLGACLRSILDQDGPSVRVLIVDDASVDGTVDIASDLASCDGRIEYRRHDANLGYIQTFNEGLDWASSEYVILVDADDLLTPGALRRAVEILNANPQIGFVYGHPAYFRSDQSLPRVRAGNYRLKVWPGRRWLELRFKAGTNCVSTQTVVARTELRHRLGGYRHELPHTTDMETWMRLAAHADVGFIRGVDQAWQRIHPASMQRTQFSDKLIDLRQRKAAFDWLLSEQSEVLDDPHRLRRLSDRALAREALWRACRTYDRGRAEAEPVDDLIQFATATYSGARRLREWSSLRWRERVGKRVCPYLQPLLLPATARQLRRRLWWTSWRLRGM
jgi:hypothetical protein